MSQPDRETYTPYEIFLMMQEENPEKAEESIAQLVERHQSLGHILHEAHHLMDGLSCLDELLTEASSGKSESIAGMGYSLGLLNAKVSLLLNFVDGVLDFGADAFSPEPDDEPYSGLSYEDPAGVNFIPLSLAEVAEMMANLKDTRSQSPKNEES